MARKKTDARKAVEDRFIGNSAELKVYLLKKKKFFEQLLNDKNRRFTEEQISKIGNYVKLIEEVLGQKYFIGDRIYTMPELIQEIKIERDEIKAIKDELKEAERLARNAFSAEKSYLANKYEEIYNSPGQIELRKLIDEYQALVYRTGGMLVLEKCDKTLVWLLGIIHRPVGFFEKVLS